MYVCMYVCMCVCVWLCIDMCVYMYVCVLTCVIVCIYVHLCVLYVFVHVYVYITFSNRYRTNDSKGDLTSLSSNTDPMGAKQSGDIHITKLYPGNPPASKRIWKCAVEQHTFFRFFSTYVYLSIYQVLVHLSIYLSMYMYLYPHTCITYLSIYLSIYLSKRLQVPERPSRLQQVFRRGSKFRYSGRTFKQLQAAKDDDREEPNFIRTHSERLRENPRKQFGKWTDFYSVV